MREGWTYKKLGEVASFSRGLTYSKSDVSTESSKMVLRSNNIDLATHSLVFDDIAYLKEEFEIPTDKMLHKNDIFICMSNGSTKHLGKVAFVEKELDYAFGGFMGAIHPKTNEVYPKYAFYSCLSSSYDSFLSSILNGININNLKWSDLSQFIILIPPLSEQERIVSELDLLSGIIEKKKAQLKEYDQLAQSIFYDMFGDPVTNEKGWEASSFGHIMTPAKINKCKSHSELPILSITMHGGIVKQEDRFKKVIASKDVTGYKIIKRGQLVIAFPIDEGLIYTQDIEDEGIMSPAYNVWDVDYSKVSSLFLRYHLHCAPIMKYYKEKLRGTTQRRRMIPKEDLLNLPIPIPPLSLQQSFAEKIEAIERQKALTQQSITEAETLFNSRMDYYFN